MIKKEIKAFDFIEKENRSWFNPNFVSPGVYTIEHDITVVNAVGIGNYPNEWSVQLGGNRVLQMGEDGNLNIQGQIRALGTVVYDETGNRLKFWDGNQFVEFGPIMI